MKNILSNPGYINELSIVATIKNEIVGYVILTIATINEHLGLSLGPIAIKPEYQSLEIEKKLIASSINKARKLKYNWIALTGSDYYLSSGFVPAEPFGIVLSENNPENMFLKILYLNEEKRDSVKGVMKFCDSFYNENGELL